MSKLSIFSYIIFFYCIVPVCYSGEKIQKYSLDFIYIDSSVDESAGGHAALRLGQNVFHYQYHHKDGFFLLVKENWTEFKYNYTNLQNRSLYIAKIPIKEKTFKKIKTQFLTRFLLQNKRLLQLEKLNEEVALFRKAIDSNCEITIKGLGFFSKKSKADLDAIKLRSFIAEKLGINYIENIQQDVNERIEKIVNKIQPVSIIPKKLNLYASSDVYSSWLNEFIELKELQEALFILEKASPVDENSIIYTSEDIADISDVQLKVLNKYRDKIKDSILCLLRSSRPDKGSALLIQAARYQVLSRSVKLKQFVTLDPFSKDAEIKTLDSFLSSYIAVSCNNEEGYRIFKKRNLFEQIKIEQLKEAQVAINNFFMTRENMDIAFNQLESELGRLSEIVNARNNNGKIRIEEGVLLPQKEKKVTSEFFADNKKILNKIKKSMFLNAVYKKQLIDIYGYNLINRNCVTEIFETVYSCFPTKELAKCELGGYFDVKEIVSFIPFCAFYLLNDKFKDVTIDICLSYRKRQKVKLCENGNIWDKIKESNTLSSSIYIPWKEDSTFLFFTDDVILMRPLYGIGNTFFAAANMVGGVLWIPFDKGSLLKRSARGIVFSLPELAFFNIRKGTFPATAVEN